MPADAWVITYLVAINAFALAAAGWDKLRARRGGHRLRESTLLAGALLGGSAGLVAGMLVFRHKVRKTSFLARLAVVLLAQLAIVLWWLR